MVKIWGKILIEDKIIKSTTVEVEPSKTSFFEVLQNLCYQLNIPTPILMDKHVHDFNLFHFSSFRPDDFVESVNFDKLVLQLISDD